MKRLHPDRAAVASCAGLDEALAGGPITTGQPGEGMGSPRAVGVAEVLRIPGTDPR